MTGPTHLIIVCCHAIYLGPDCSDESNWLIEPFQSGETGTFTAHIEAGVRELARDNDALLVFSGGATKREKTDITEGESYLVSLLCMSSPGARRVYAYRPATDGEYKMM